MVNDCIHPDRGQVAGLRRTLRLGTLALCVLIAGLGIGSQSFADTYKIDIPGMHANIQFRVKHLGFSWLYGRFNQFDGTFEYDPEAIEKSWIRVQIDMSSLDSNHAERDKHLRSADFLNTDEFPTATFLSTKVTDLGDGNATIAGELTLHGVTRPVTLEARYIGGGDDPWGGYRQGFHATTTIQPADYGINMAVLGPASQDVELDLAVEGVRIDKD